jgi:hypothetical protein
VNSRLKQSSRFTGLGFIAAISIATILLLGCQQTLAAALTCSTEQQACVVICKKTFPRGTVGTCIANCSTRKVQCIRTGCWQSDTNHYCGLSRQ